MRFVLTRVQLIIAAAIAITAIGVTTAASAQTVSGNGTGTNNGFYYSLYSSGGSATMTLGTAGNYAITWSGVSDVVGGKGWNPGSAQVIGYNVGSASGYNTISIYGWLTSPLVEYYITEFGSLYTADATEKGSVTSDGHTYTTWEHQQQNQPSIQGTQTFEQYLDAWGGAAMGQNNVVTTANHFSHWSSLGMTVGSFNYQILGTEAYNGASGSVNATVCANSCGGSSGGGGSTPSFNLSPSASSVSVTQGASATDTIELQDVDGFSGSVTLSASGMPSGVTASFGTNPTTGNSTLTLTASSSAATGNSTITITGTSGSITKTTTIALTVNSSSSGSSGGGCTVDYTISQYNSTQFGATIGIKNGGSSALSGWSLTWSFANGQTITSSWNGAVSQSGANVTVSEQSGQTWENIPAGGTYTGFGFNGSSSGTNSIPTNFKLNGTTCTIN
ncbi:MAG: glycoside hydrolase family 11 protein [Terracidiphilus sp.]